MFQSLSNSNVYTFAHHKEHLCSTKFNFSTIPPLLILVETVMLELFFPVVSWLSLPHTFESCSLTCYQKTIFAICLGKILKIITNFFISETNNLT